jgi:AraC-like DNA-binding protein
MSYGIPLLSSSFLLFNPAFFIYVKSLTSEKFKLKPLHLLHLAPFLIFEIIAYIVQEPYSLEKFFVSDSTQWFRFSFGIASVISWFFYNYSSAILVFKHRKRLENEFSTIGSNKSLGWLIFIVVFYNSFCGFAVILGIFLVSSGNSLFTQYIYNYSALLILIYILGFYGLRQKQIFQPAVNEISEPSILPKLIKNSNLTPERINFIRVALIEYVEKEKAYLNPDLNMNFLSEVLNIPKHQLTEVLNSDMGKNFFRFINEYRVEAVKKLLADTKNNYSIEAIGYECGFNSKSSFFTIFKNITGQTPLIYKLSIEKNNNGVSPQRS